MNYAARILSDLDRRLHQAVELTLYGRAAFQLGFQDPPKEFSQSLDVDAVLWLGQDSRDRGTRRTVRNRLQEAA